MKIAVLCGGPSLERGISLNSARSVLDHLEGDGIEIVPYYFDYQRKAYRISKAQLYSNTPSDFDFKLRQTAQALSENGLIKKLKQADLVFPVMHGSFGEDGGIQSFLERRDIPFIGSSAAVCKRAFDKFIANEFIKSQGFYTLPSVVLKIYHRDHKKILQQFFSEHKIKRAIVKPAGGGSSIGVFSVNTVEEALVQARGIFSKRLDTRVVVEPFAEGVEFTTIILENRFGLPVCILPTEIEADYTKHQIFDFRKKYLPTRQVTYHCPPRFDNSVIERIQVQAEQLFKMLGMRDFSRFDGWVMKDGSLWFSDFNPISGMEQNSFLFQQASRIGMSHRDVLRYIVRQACRRYNIPFPEIRGSIAPGKRKPVHVLFGGSTSERQVSLMSGTNVWLKLLQSARYEPKPFLLDSDNKVWELPYAFTLNHTVEEIAENCRNAPVAEARLHHLEQKVRLRLALRPGDASEPLRLPKKYSFEQFLNKADFIFIALHGGIGEDGTLQKLFDKHRIKYNGSGPEASSLCIDKWATAEFVRQSGIPGVAALPGMLVPYADLRALAKTQLRQFWLRTCRELGARSLIIKPRADGCSSGIIHLFSASDLERYLRFYGNGSRCIPHGAFRNQRGIVDLPLEPVKDFLIEKFQDTDTIQVVGNKLKHRHVSGWIEITAGVVQRGRSLEVLNPSITVAEGEVLSVEEKFQGGTGINITPPPKEIVRAGALIAARKRIGELAQTMRIQGYARIDAFLQVDTGNLNIIEVNSLPGLTPSTVLYHQALAERPSVFPRELLENFIKNKNY